MSQAICTLSLHDALPISAVSTVTSGPRQELNRGQRVQVGPDSSPTRHASRSRVVGPCSRDSRERCALPSPMRSEEHTSELQSRFDLVCRLLLEKQKDTAI